MDLLVGLRLAVAVHRLQHDGPPRLDGGEQRTDHPHVGPAFLAGGLGLAALQGFFASDFRAVAAGVTMTVVPILLFFVVVQRYFIRGLSGAVKG